MGAGQSIGPFPVVGSVVVGKDKDGTEIRRNPEYKDKLIPSYFDDVTTMYEAFQRGLRVSRNDPCYGTRKKIVEVGEGGKTVVTYGDYEWLTYQQVQDRIDAFGSGILHMDLIPTNDQGLKLLGIFSKNRMEWCIAENACHAFGAADVALYDTLGEEAMAFIVQLCQLKTIVTTADGAKQLTEMKKNKPEEMKTLKAIVQFEDVRINATVQACADVDVALYTMAEVEATGKKNPSAHKPPKPDDLGYICFTSGTTGMPKGAMISHKNEVADASAAYTAHLAICRTDVHLSYLPLAHTFERLVQCAFQMSGAMIGFYQGDTLKITEDLKALRPTVFASVPRLYNRIYEKIMAGVEEKGGLGKALFLSALETKKSNLNAYNTVKHSFWDALVFKGVAGKVGLDRVRVCLTGSAPIAPHVVEFVRCVFQTHVCEGYGQTENSAACTLTAFTDQATKNHVGGPLASNEIKLASVPEMGYLTTDKVHDRQVDKETGKEINAGVPCFGRGEVCLRGVNIFMGYYKDKERTAEALDADGWLHTGDIGIWDSNQNLRIVDRKKNIFKLSQGEYVAAEKIEIVMAKSSFVASVWVYGDSLRSCLVAVCVPSADNLKNWAKGGAKEKLSFEELCNDAEVKKVVLDDIVKTCKAARLNNIEIIKNIHLESKPWTPDDVLTPTLKMKRHDAKLKYQSVINAMYKEVDGK